MLIDRLWWVTLIAVTVFGLPFLQEGSIFDPDQAIDSGPADASSDLRTLSRRAAAPAPTVNDPPENNNPITPPNEGGSPGTSQPEPSELLKRLIREYAVFEYQEGKRLDVFLDQWIEECQRNDPSVSIISRSIFLSLLFLHLLLLLLID